MKMKVHWQGLVCLFARTANRDLPSFRLTLHIFFSLCFCFQSWQLHKSTIQVDLARDAGDMNGAFLVLLAPCPFVLSLFRVLLATLRSGNFAKACF